jgi:glycosyltransferase involved in cell wall biosynthesis
MKIWYVSHYAVPEEISIGWRSQYIAKALSEAGHELTIWAASQHHLIDNQKKILNYKKIISNYNYKFCTINVPSYKGNGLGRLINIFTFCLGMKHIIKNTIKNKNNPDLIIVSSPHPFVWKYLYKNKYKTIKMIFEERDLWPLSLIKIVNLSTWHPIVIYLERLMRKIYEQADGIISVLSNSEEFLKSKGLPAGRFFYIPNGVDPSIFCASEVDNLPKSHLEAINKVREKGKLIVIYAGNMGPPNALESLLELSIIATEKPYHIFLMGDGVNRIHLENKIKSDHIDYITILPPLTRQLSWKIIEKSDIAIFCTLNINLYDYGLSFNKIFDYYMLGKPIIGVVSTDIQPVSFSGGGLTVPPGNPKALDHALRQMAILTKDELAALGKKGQDYILKHHNWKILGEKFVKICESIHNNI